MNGSNTYLKPRVPLIVSLLLLSSVVSAAGVMESTCLYEQLHRVHAHWHRLVVEPDPGARAQLIREHRELVDSLRRVAETGALQVGANCPQDVIIQRQDLENMLEMHSMMLDMVE